MLLNRIPVSGQRGVTLIEALITVVILSMAALGYAALQLRGLSTNAGAMWRSKATVLAAEAGDRLRANAAGVAAGHYNALLAPGTAPTCTLASPCTIAQIAALDFAAWRLALAQALPEGSGVICLDATSNDGQLDAPACDGSGTQLAVKVFWRERGVHARLVQVVRP